MNEETILSRPSFQWGTCLIGAGGLFWTVVQIRDQTLTLWPRLPLKVFRAALIAGYAFGLIGALLIIGTLLKRSHLWKHLRSWFREVGDHVLVPFLECGPSRRDELKALHDFGEDDFGRVSALSLMEGLYDKHPKSFWSVRSAVGSEDQKLVGYFIMYPLSQRSCVAVEQGRLTGLNLAHSDITTSFKKARGIYVGAVYGISLRPQAVALEGLKNQLAVYGARLPFYARPVSPDGKRIMTKYGFAQWKDAADGIEIWKRHPQP